MTREYGCEFLFVPNCASKESVNAIDIEAALRNLSTRDDVFFIFLGAFASGRGIEDLIGAWSYVDKRAHLILQGRDNLFKTEMVELARSHGLLGDRVTFPQPVDTSDLVQAARQADVGIIPYGPTSVNNRYCCPNKLSQYMAAGLPIICNKTEFVKNIVLDHEIGAALDFHDHKELARVVNNMIISKNQIVEMGRRAHRFFETQFNWGAVSGEMYARLRAAVPVRANEPCTEFDFSWIERACQNRSWAAQSGDAYSRSEIERLNDSYSAEIERLNRVYPAEIERLNQVYPAEIKRLNDVYSAEVSRLNDMIALQKATGLSRFAGENFRRVRRLLAKGRSNYHANR